MALSIIPLLLSFWIWRVWKEREKYTKNWISQEWKESFRWNKTFFIVSEGLSFGEKQVTTNMTEPP